MGPWMGPNNSSVSCGFAHFVIGGCATPNTGTEREGERERDLVFYAQSLRLYQGEREREREST